YGITQAESEFLKPGMRVAVPFGKSKIYTGLVFAIHQQQPLAYEAKDIHQILDEAPIITQNQLAHWQWIANYYLCTLGDVLRATLPNSFLLESEAVITKNDDKVINESDLRDDEFLVYEALHHQSSLKLHDLVNILDKKNVLSVI